MSSWDQGVASTSMKNKCRGVRRRKWGKWVSEIRVPGTKDRLWLGSFSTCEAAGVAHDVASYCLRGPSSLTSLNFPAMLPAAVSVTTAAAMSPTSVQKAASEAGMAVDAQLIVANAPPMPTTAPRHLRPPFGIQTFQKEPASSTQPQPLDISVDDYL